MRSNLDWFRHAFTYECGAIVLRTLCTLLVLVFRNTLGKVLSSSEGSSKEVQLKLNQLYSTAFLHSDIE